MDKYKRKILLLGDGAVGKTSLVRRYVQNAFSDEYIATVGANIKKKSVDYPDKDLEVDLVITDLIGQQGYQETQKMNMAGSHGALMVSDLKREKTLDSLEEYWINECLEEVFDDIPSMIFLANKSDLVDLESDELKDYRSALFDLSEKYESKFYFTSAKTGKNVENAFRDIGLLSLESEEPGTYYRRGLYSCEDGISPKKALDLFKSQLFLELGGQGFANSVIQKKVKDSSIDVLSEDISLSKLEELVEDIKDAESPFLPDDKVEEFYRKRRGILNKVEE